ncbi:transcriptional regulator GcvA [Rhodoplanes sp. TEM]|uniref:Transcriptional regulator GcvA n=1 Tax=Rhodoplanes tepidamans TaxID=200616 RepID=A0ABT5J5C5_RHOTP|nr:MULTISPECIES: transcriptional regulator GcvA [Rhodoplanes]MDC7784657.1 transcriptional regulator GcvA [Rhodoplanes tepidamans]MDC7982124.1 transcriptional regulator GcvA [Rhodoplanes sp. TEM]MDQ0356126.1 LysR family glycine cleavage system transcriptional activator [Rhodoplanes tepidamans]
MKSPSLRSIQVFEAAARLGSFAAAAEELLLTPSAVSHQIRDLEREVGVVLFHRAHRAIVLTDTGRRFAVQVSEGLGLIAAAKRSIERGGKSDILTIHTVPSFGSQWLMPRLSRFSASEPDIDVRLNASVGAVDLAAGEADFDIRYGNVFPAWGVEVRPFPEETIVVLCAPALAKGRKALRTPSDLHRHTLIHSEVNLVTWSDWLRLHGVANVDLSRGPRFDRSFMAISAAADGVGIALESRLLIHRELESGRLVLPFGDDGPRLVCHRLLYLKSKLKLPKMRRFRDWLLDELAASER